MLEHNLVIPRDTVAAENGLRVSVITVCRDVCD